MLCRDPRVILIYFLSAVCSLKALELQFILFLNAEWTESLLKGFITCLCMTRRTWLSGELLSVATLPFCLYPKAECIACRVASAFQSLTAQVNLECSGWCWSVLTIFFLYVWSFEGVLVGLLLVGEGVVGFWLVSFFWSVSWIVGFDFFVFVAFWRFVCFAEFCCSCLFVGVLLEDQFCWLLAVKCPENTAALFTCCLRATLNWKLFTFCLEMDEIVFKWS